MRTRSVRGDELFGALYPGGTVVFRGGDPGGGGQGMGVLEAPRGVLVHDHPVDRGRVERLRLTVATQFDNAYSNLLLRDLAGRREAHRTLHPELRSMHQLRDALTGCAGARRARPGVISEGGGR